MISFYTIQQLQHQEDFEAEARNLQLSHQTQDDTGETALVEGDLWFWGIWLERVTLFAQTAAMLVCAPR